MDSEDKIREKVRALRQFYTNLMIYGAITLGCFLIWLTTGGTFWPLWVIVGFLISALLQGIKIGIFPFLEDIFPFLKPEWEEKQVQQMMQDEDPHTKI